jgi:hypothetical protein
MCYLKTNMFNAPRKRVKKSFLKKKKKKNPA